MIQGFADYVVRLPDSVPQMTKPGFKDYFSTRSDAYARYRPHYPEALFAWLAEHAPGTGLCWDCATGSGQAALALSHYFDRVIATDASSAQITSAVVAERVDYRVAPAEESGLATASMDLVMVAQALHWFDIPAFFREADRVLKEQGLLAVLSYRLLSVDPAVDEVILALNHDILDGYWPAERRLIEQRLSTFRQ